MIEKELLVKQKPFIPFSRPWIDETEIEAVSQVLASKWISTGARVREFERAFAEYLGVKHAIAVSSCTAALHLSLLLPVSVLRTKSSQHPIPLLLLPKQSDMSVLNLFLWISALKH